jgi:hypothetical protein
MTITDSRAIEAILLESYRLEIHEIVRASVADALVKNPKIDKLSLYEQSLKDAYFNKYNQDYSIEDRLKI